MKIWRYTTEKHEQEIPSPSFFKFGYDHPCGEANYYIKVEEEFKTEIYVSDGEEHKNVHLSKEEWDGQETEFFKWKESTLEEFEKWKQYALKHLAQ